MSVSRFTVAERVDNYARNYFSSYVPEGDLPESDELEPDEPTPTEPERPERPTWYTGRDRNNPDQDFRAR